MEEARVLVRLERISALDEANAPAREVLAGLRELLRDVESSTPTDECRGREEVVERPSTAQVGT